MLGLFLQILLGCMFFYYLGIYWLVYGRGEFKVVYNPFMGWVLRTFLGGMEAIVLGARCYIYKADDPITPERIEHEKFHYTNQWLKYPYTFLFRYLYYKIRFGYGKNPIEQEARISAGEKPR
jgi:hypothetical protein